MCFTLLFRQASPCHFRIGVSNRWNLLSIEVGFFACSCFSGNVTFVPITNPLAYQRGQRIGERNLNRNLRVTTEPKDYEDRIANALCPLIGQHDALIDLHSFQSPGEPFAMIGPMTNEDELEPFAFSMPEEALALRLGVRRFVHGWMPTYAAGVANRIKRADESGLPDARAQLLNTDPTYGIGTTEYIRSVGGLGISSVPRGLSDAERVGLFGGNAAAFYLQR